MTTALEAELLTDFETEARERLERLEELLLAMKAGAAEALAGNLVDDVRRELHTLKGNAGMVGLDRFQAATHAMEDLAEELDPEQPEIGPLLAAVDRLRAGLTGVEGAAAAPAPPVGAPVGLTPPALPALAGPRATAEEARAPAVPANQAADANVAAAGSVRIPVATLDALVDLLAEVLIGRHRLAAALGRSVPPPGGDGEAKRLGSEIADAHQRLETTLQELQEGVLRLRMMPLRGLFRQLARLAHDTSRQEGKQIRLVIEGGETPLDKALLELAGEALGHLVRNAVVHGIEAPAERRRAGKDEHGTLRLAAHVTARDVAIDVEDDGGGVQEAAVRAAAGRLGSALGPTTQLVELLFLPGVSTRQRADLGAGRGVGLDAVKAAVERQGGRIEVASEVGRGSLFRLRLPLTASITRALMVRCDGEVYALPLRSVLESLQLGPGDLHEIDGAGALRWRGRLVTALDLGCVFATAPRRRRAGYAVVLGEGSRSRALVVDQVLSIREIVVKRLDRLLASMPGVAGSTVLGDGRAVLILDSLALVDMPPRMAAVS